MTLNGALNYARDTRAAIFRLGQFTKGNSQVSFRKPEYSWTWLPVCLESEHHALKLCRTHPQAVLPGMGQQSLLEDRQIKCVCPGGRGGRARQVLKSSPAMDVLWGWHSGEALWDTAWRGKPHPVRCLRTDDCGWCLEQHTFCVRNEDGHTLRVFQQDER